MIVEKTSTIPKRKETTSAQTITYSFGDGVLSRDYSKCGNYVQLRAVRKDPTVKLARALLIACIQAGSWNVESDEDVSDDVAEFLEHVLPLREDFLYNAIAYGKVDYGWCGFEKIFTIEGNRIVIKSLKPLLHDITTILVTPQGHFNGYRQNPMSGTPLDVPVEKCLHIAFGIEAGNLYGMPLLEDIRATSDDWHDCNDGAKRYDLKMAGSQPIIKFPPGTAEVDGEQIDNCVIASQVLAAMMSGGGVTVPQTTIAYTQEILNADQAACYRWDVDVLEDRGKKQAEFNDRLKYLDSQKVRGLGMPERSLLEGQFGTKAEAGVHGDLATANMEQLDRTIVSMINEQLINQLVRLNYGPAMVGKVRLVAAPLIDKQISFFRDLYKKLVDSDLDVSALRDKLDLPTEIGGSEGLKKEKDEEDDE